MFICWFAGNANSSSFGAGDASSVLYIAFDESSTLRPWSTLTAKGDFLKVPQRYGEVAVDSLGVFCGRPFDDIITLPFDFPSPAMSPI